MNQLKELIRKYKNIIIGGVLIIVMFIAYNIFYLGPKQEQEGAGAIRAENQDATSSQIGREIITTLNRLKTINIDPEFFMEERFQRLIDFSVEIQEQPVGKNNPFRAVDLFANTNTEGEVEGVEALADSVEIEEEDQATADGPGA